MNAFRYRRRTLFDMQLRLLDIAIISDPYAVTLNALESGIRSATKRIEDAGDDDDGVADYETDVIENLLGVAYVTCQAQITGIAEAASNIDGYGLRDFDVRQLGPRFDATYSKIEILWALGNYFKHRDQWNDDTWSNPPNENVKRTVNAIMAAGLKENSRHGNLRTGSAALGNSSFSDLSVFEDLINRWATDVRADVLNKRKP